MPRWIQDPETHKLVPAEEYSGRNPDPGYAIHGPIEPFKSPIDGSTISDRRQLREHNARHGVVNTGEFGPNDGKAYFDRRAKERADFYQGKTGRKERIESIKRALHQHGVEL